MKKIIIFGSINSDFSINVSHMPEVGETIHGDGLLISPGGKGQNQAVAAARLGGDVHLIGRIGDDSYGHQILMSLKRENVRTTFVKLDKNHPTASAFILRSHGDNRIIVNSGANEYLSADDLNEFISSHDDIPGSIFITQLEIRKEEAIKALQAAKKAGMITILNPSPASKLPEEVYKDIDLLVVNQNECRLLSSYDSSLKEEREKAYKYFASKGVKSLIVTLGAKGSEVYEEGKMSYIPAYKIESVDSTGAGDTYLGGVGYGLSKDMSLLESAKLASASSALKCLRLGAQPGMPSYEKTIKFISEYEKGGNKQYV